MYELYIHRACGKRISDERVEKQVAYILGRALGGSRGMSWKGEHRVAKAPYQHGNKWIFTYRLKFEKTRGRKGGEAEYKQWENIKAMVIQSGKNSKFAPYLWKLANVVDAKKVGSKVESITAVTNNTILAIPKDTDASIPDVTETDTDISGIRDVTHFEKVLTWKDLGNTFDPVLLSNDEALCNHPCFNEIYNRNPQIRTVLSAVKSGIDSDGLRRPHGVLWGHAGCGKTSILLALENYLGAGSMLRLDATSTTRAGLEKMFFQDLPVVPPIVVMEEIEKANEDALKLWLGALDDRGEIRKVNFRVSKVRQINILFFCTVNNKQLFNKMMGSDGKEQGALASRCVTDIYCPRPDEEVLRRILKRDIQKYGGNELWIEPCIKLAGDLGVNDPRKVLAFLAGGERLLTGEYQEDRLKIHEAEQSFAMGA